MQRFRGKLGERQEPFVLQGSEIVENGKIKTIWFVVPGSGTGDLSGLRGAALKATLEKGPTRPWITGSNDVATVRSPLRRKRSVVLGLEVFSFSVSVLAA